ncbi:MAG: [protein-PII] uridylyltransferase [Burkholderiales bacterium]|jgi:[protein-PII] uridylyltransferase|nr:[protein-PII] uridylyltransferase [Burkholderiales bacterium]
MAAAGPFLTPEQLAAHRAALSDARRALRDAFAAHPGTTQLLRRHSLLVDRFLRALWRSLPAAVTRRGVLIATGGYGRGTLFPHSDIDTAVILPEPPDDATRAALAWLETALWDVGLAAGHAVRTLDELHNIDTLDITVQTALVEHRYLAGSRSLYRRFEETLATRLTFSRFFEAKRFEQEQRHLKYRDALYNLEPNLKESPGGLRDVHVLRWLARAAGVGARWRQLVERGLLTAAEARALQQHEHWLNTLRVRLHYLAGRAEERLLFDHQTALAEQMHITGKGPRRAGEVLMQRYYRAAQTIRRLNTLLLQAIEERFAPPPETRPLDAYFTQRGDLLDIDDPQRLAQTPSVLFDTFLHWQHHAEIVGLSSRTLRALDRARPGINRAFRANPANRTKFIDLFRVPRGILHTLRVMNLYGLLGQYLPPFGRIVGQMQHDLFHVYTVDEHILMTVRNLRRFEDDNFAYEYPLCSRLMNDFARPEILYLAALFHDIAKGRGSDHARRGSFIARRFCAQHPISKDDAALIVWLVRKHLLMSLVAQKEDISDPRTIARFTRRVGSERRLVALYLLTVADIRATSPKVWNPWKAQLLETLFLAARTRLRRGNSDDSDSIARKQRDAREHLRERGTGEPSALWQALDMAYFQRHSLDDLCWHAAELHDCLDTEKPIVRVRPLPQDAGLKIMAYLRDRPGLFAQLCHFFGRHHLNILDARIHTTRHGYALDTFAVHTADPRYADTSARSALEDSLSHFLQQPPPAAPLPMGRKSRRLQHFPLTPHVHITPDDDQRHDLLEIVAGDRTGLLAHLAHTLANAGINVESARINTMGERVEDVFVISGEALENPAQRVALETELQKVLLAP